MKNMNNKLLTTNIDPISEARKSEKFQQYSEDVMPRIRLATEVYNSRNILGLSQQALAKEIDSTQKVVSKVENGDMNLGIELLNRFVGKLHFTSDHLARVFNCPQAYVVITAGVKKVETKNQSIVIATGESLSPVIGTMVTGAVFTSFYSPSGVTLGSNSIKLVNK